ncbi:MAG: tRNA uridine-5-carboxymethylaminomethyl(34) synthesis GTPase MnmE [Spirochaetaceae bacterium]|nr:tRNA uridine-5-carboxymethylaminomethyl(34) synthesis GTPase MnmE [Spirochaetaceae bacterium]
MDTTGYTPEEPIAAIATALAPAALGIIRCSGKGCFELVSKIFSRPKTLLNAPGNTIVYGWIVDSSEETLKRIDEVLLNVFRGPKSFTGEDMIEINCHGGPAVITEIFRLLTENGFRSANKGEFTFRAFINGKADLTQAEAIHEIISAKTDESRSRAAGRLAGNLYDRIDSIKTKLITVLASIEAEIEYPEDEETIADAFDDSELRVVQQELKDLCDSWASEKLYQDGARIILCGKTNAGKSSLFNTLLKEERAIVSDIHGTTRDWIESWISFAGIPARLFDTAGLRQTEDVIEQHGVQRTLDLTEDADLMLYVVDSTQGLSKEDSEFLEKQTAPVVLVLNKSDISNSVLNIQTKNPVVKISAKTGEGVGQLTEVVRDILASSATSERNLPGLGSVRQKQCAQNALESVSHGLEASEDGYTLDAVVQDIEDALDFLGEITGNVTPEDILDTVFSRFCLGK